MGRANKDENPVSLFAFQDIITSLTGIMLLIVIMLVISIFETNTEVVIVDAEKKAKVSKSSVGELEETVKRLRQQLEQNKAWLRENAARINAISKLNLEEMKTRYQNASQKLDELKKKLAAAESEAGKINQQVEVKRIAVQLAKKDILEAVKVLPNLDKKYKKLMAELTEREAVLQRKAKVLSITVARDDPKKPIVVECSPDGIRCKEIASGTEYDFRVPGSITNVETVNKFIAWTKTRDPKKEYFVLAITPDAFNYTVVLLDKLKETGFERGKEVLPDNRTTFFSPKNNSGSGK